LLFSNIQRTEQFCQSFQAACKWMPRQSKIELVNCSGFTIAEPKPGQLPQQRSLKKEFEAGAQLFTHELQREHA